MTKRLGLHRALVFAAASLRVAPAFGVEPPTDKDSARPCRPTVSCTADIVSPGALEVEVGAFSTQIAGDQRLQSVPILLKQSFTTFLQLQVGSNGYTTLRTSPTAANTHYVDSLVVGPKFHVLDQGRVAPSVALSAAGSVPAFATGPAAGLFTAYASKDVGPVHFDWNVGLNVLWRQRSDTAAQAFTALAASATPTPPFGVAVEGYAFSGGSPWVKHDGGVRAALTLTPRGWLVFDVGGDIGWYPSTHASSLFLGMTVVPVLFWRST